MIKFRISHDLLSEGILQMIKVFYYKLKIKILNSLSF